MAVLMILWIMISAGTEHKHLYGGVKGHDCQSKSARGEEVKLGGNADAGVHASPSPAHLASKELM